MKTESNVDSQLLAYIQHKNLKVKRTEQDNYANYDN